MSRISQNAGRRWLETVRFAKAQIATGVATGLEWLLLAALLAVHVNYLVAAALGAITGAFVDFSIKKWWAFSARGGMLYAQGLRYAAVSLLSAVFNCLIAYAFVDGLNVPALPGVILTSVIVGVAWNYPMHRLYVFAKAVGTSKEGSL